MHYNSRSRLFFYLSFVVFYLTNLYLSIYVRGFELDSDFLNYYIFYNAPGLHLDRWGIEAATPFVFWLGKILELDFFGFCFFVGFLWLFPIFLMSRKIRVEYLLFYYLFFVIWFSPQYIFLFRNYLAIFFIFLFFLSAGKYRFAFLVFSLTSHLATLIVLAFSFLRLKSRLQYFSAAFFSVTSYIFFNLGFSLLSSFKGFFYQTGIYDFDRKLSTLSNLSESYSSGSHLVYIVLCFAVITHSIKIITTNGSRFSLERAFFFSAIASLILSEFVIFSNRVGMLAYFFSIPYLSMVFSRYSVKYG